MSKTYATCGHEIHEGISTSILENDEVITYGTYCVDCLSNFYKNKVLLNRELMTIFSTIKKLKQENKKLKDCVQWYYENEIVSFDRYTEVSSCGQFKYATNLKARQTLKEIEEQNEKNYN